MEFSTWRKTDYLAMAIVACLIVAAILAIVPGYPAVGRWWCGLDGPAWVQACGSVVAIFAAIGIAQHQHRTARAAETERVRSAQATYLRASYLAVREAKFTLAYITSRLAANEGLALYLRTERIESLLVTFEALAMKDSQLTLLEGILGVQRELSYTLMALRQLKDAPCVTLRRVQGARDRERRVGAVLRSFEKKQGLAWTVFKNFNNAPGALEDADFSEMEAY